MNKSYGHQMRAAEISRNSNSIKIVNSCDSDVHELVSL